MCINIFFLLINVIDKKENIKIGIPNTDGMYEVNELLLLKKLIITPQIIRKIP